MNMTMTFLNKKYITHIFHELLKFLSRCGMLEIHPIRTLYPNKIIVSNKLLGMLGLGSGLGFRSGSFYMHEMTIPITIGIIKRCNQ